jgi:hypothetical protein
MRASGQSSDGKLRVTAIAGTRAVLIALDMNDADRKGLTGFAMRSGKAGQPLQWLTGMKVFKSLAPSSVPAGKSMHFTTDKNPIQSFLWSDYEATPATDYAFEVSAIYGQPGNLQPRQVVAFKIKTEPKNDGRHGVWFNRGAIASQAFAEAGPILDHGRKASSSTGANNASIILGFPIDRPATTAWFLRWPASRIEPGLGARSNCPGSRLTTAIAAKPLMR